VLSNEYFPRYVDKLCEFIQSTTFTTCLADVLSELIVDQTDARFPRGAQQDKLALHRVRSLLARERRR
jgi:hypothetical protein